VTEGPARQPIVSSQSATHVAGGGAMKAPPPAPPDRLVGLIRMLLRQLDAQRAGALRRRGRAAIDLERTRSGRSRRAQVSDAIERRWTPAEQTASNGQPPIHQKGEATMTGRSMAAAIDKSLANEVKRELEWEPGVEAASVGVEVKGGAVTLKGRVRSYSERRAAVRAAERVYGVQAVADEIDVRLSRDDSHDDASIGQAIQDRFKWSVVVPSSVKAEVRDGFVTLRGEVDRYSQRQEPERVVRDVKGVKGVVNAIVVKPEVNTAQVEEEVSAALMRSAELDARAIRVGRVDGTVHLYGHVHSFHEREAAEQAAAAAPGVATVDNQIVVAP
jgi:osmotically-inducible protein OsmY